MGNRQKKGTLGLSAIEGTYRLIREFEANSGNRGELGISRMRPDEKAHRFHLIGQSTQQYWIVSLARAIHENTERCLNGLLTAGLHTYLGSANPQVLDLQYCCNTARELLTAIQQSAPQSAAVPATIESKIEKTIYS